MAVIKVTVEASRVDRAAFTGIHVHTTIDGDMNQAEKEAFLHDVDAHCPISDNVKNLTSVEFDVE